MAGFDITAADKVLKVFYLGPVREQLNNSTILLSRLDRDSSTQDVSGKSFTVPLHIGRNETAGIGVAENGALPDAGAQSYANAIVPNKFVYGRIQISGPVIAATKSNAGAFIKAIESEIKGCMKDTKRAVNRQLHGDGKDALCYYAAGAGTEITVDDGLGNPFTHLGTGAVKVDSLDASDTNKYNFGVSQEAGVATSTTLTYKSEDASAVTVTVSRDVNAANAALADGDAFVPAGTRGKQMMGIAGIISAADPVVGVAAGAQTGLHGLAVASNPWWAAQVVGSDASKVDLSFPLMQKVFSKVATNSDYSEADIKLLLCSYQMRDKYVELCTNERRFYNTMTLDGGFEAVEYNGKPLVPDAQCKHNRIYFIVLDTLALFRSHDFDWMDQDGSSLHRVAGYDAYEAVLFHYGDLGCKSRNGNGLLCGINE